MTQGNTTFVDKVSDNSNEKRGLSPEKFQMGYYHNQPSTFSEPYPPSLSHPPAPRTIAAATNTRPALAP